MKYGLLYYKDTDNIGDDIQTYAQKRFLPKIDYYIDREKLGMFVPNRKETVSVIMNAWYMHNKIAWPPSPYIKPLLTSMHFTANTRINGNYSFLADFGGQYLRENEPIGCRDQNTLNLLNQYGINGYFSGCMTLTIKPFEKIRNDDYICLVDVDKNIIDKVKKSTNRKMKIISHTLNPLENSKKSIEERMQNVENLLKIYQKSHLVITTRLHAMLPSIALKTPVILIQDDKYENDRLDTYTKMVDCYKTSEFITKDINDLIENPKQNSNSYLEIARRLENDCNIFINSREEKHDLPELSKFKEELDEKQYYSNLYDSCMKQSLKNIEESDFYYNEKQDRDKLIYDYKEQLCNKEKEINRLLNLVERKENHINNLLNSKTYKLGLKFKKMLNPVIELQKKIKTNNHNEIILKNIEVINGNKVVYHYDINGSESFKKIFWLGIPFSVEYSENVENVPNDILVIPFVCNVLPIIWFNNASLHIDSIDKDFYNSIPNLKKAYKNMLSNIKFGGKIYVKEIIENRIKLTKKTVTFFSGGVDSFSTLICNLKLKPSLITICGGAIDFNNEKEWNNVKFYTTTIGKQFNLQNLFIKSSLRAFIDNSELEKQFHDKLNDNWWHAVQYSIGMISLVAPLCYKYKISKVLFPSTYTEKEKNVICASRPEIDENLRFCSTTIVHDGYVFTRQQKVNNICNYIKKTNSNFIIRVCYRSLIGDNCCKCEKCYRSIMALIAEQIDPRKFGFNINKKTIRDIKSFLTKGDSLDNSVVSSMWRDIINKFIENKDYWINIKELSWIIEIFSK